ncbi:LysR substrate-binding domain-containing protein [Gluconobacter thailandicus]|uniref:LysR family transcriptional regulator n=1 Tax=Gluconobacter thailandicus TaxID=257438 RepID=A0AAP9EV18_GLUTH|nr:LysR substrate-binding domain-containing protein [Gluconobacter thailandicus]QEH97900.1 LysR family transcriptional regulator [Gluconobacter thailandicus]
MDLRRLRFIVQVADTRSFTRAAQALHVSQPTLSQQIRDLELELGIDLFHRGSRGVHITEAGKLVVDHARVVLGMIETLKEAVIEHRGLKRGRLHLGVIQTFNALYLPQILARFAGDFPTIDLEVSELANADVISGVQAGELHLGVGIPLGTEIGRVEPLYRDQLMFVCHSSHRLAYAKNVDVQDLPNESLALLGHGFRTRASIDNYLEGLAIIPSRVIAVNTFASILQIVSLGRYSAIMPAYINQDVKTSDVRFIPLRPAPPERTVCLLSPTEGLLTPASTEMSRRIKQHFPKL